MTVSINIKGYYIEKLCQGPACSVSNHSRTVRWTESYLANRPILMMLKTRKNGKNTVIGITWPHAGKASVRHSSTAK